jgi:pyridoxal phosphate enzyme (YggS family)
MIQSSDTYEVICASKYFSSDEIKKIYHQGYKDFGENQVQALIEKMDALRDLDITWHFIGHLQTNKVKYMINRIDLLHTLDRLSLAQMIQKHAKHTINCMIQVNISEEVQKSGVLLENLADFLIELKNYDKINIVGFMTMGVFGDINATKRVFSQMQTLKKQYHYPYLSMGMTDDYEVAIKYGATHLRIGRLFKTMIK